MFLESFKSEVESLFLCVCSGLEMLSIAKTYSLFCFCTVMIFFWGGGGRA